MSDKKVHEMNYREVMNALYELAGEQYMPMIMDDRWLELCLKIADDKEWSLVYGRTNGVCLFVYDAKGYNGEHIVNIIPGPGEFRFKVDPTDDRFNLARLALQAFRELDRRSRDSYWQWRMGDKR